MSGHPGDGAPVPDDGCSFTAALRALERELAVWLWSMAVKKTQAAVVTSVRGRAAAGEHAPDEEVSSAVRSPGRCRPTVGDGAQQGKQ
ncbi:hypothetical protein AAFF_G00078460 [Aldrovandia affinis]|uniref:Uncharacterized protein n=1 Tax=Aldrovandia affinis TaxID=143900 RepID=A0AAD7R1Q4_9TELE|nr:hypothetical protein AAFF_G00078460 [Aldrovandia affinis]